ncbi:D-alanyl-D-alanine carboxypeptidase (penicillin-binding protein 5/6) [Weissella uvarum]|uniref:D-alanyl-D-alanine carboxypeptidase family protein n=1 Tax=Weissella uvarum TaxID=1479233 RepID=UPI00195F337F|nr:serine hydrolase [Weissella uvarum]MBM7617222.1 D-alanyl-D-alanine carboxypeptidase (penicillin-binding protein 5/6) [Weissella uvarum]MCM0595515.1 D-alanyl-D-alanine carboxypeptidase [Weissella uvarum]
MSKKFKVALLSFLVALLPGQAISAAVITPKTQMQSAVVVQANTGQVLADNHGSKRLPIASITKLIVVYMLEQKISENKLSLDQQVQVPADIAKFSRDSSVANVPMSAGQTYTISQILDAALIESSNSAAMALADIVCGSQANYYKQADHLLESWGIKNPNIMSASGLENGDMGSFKHAGMSNSTENKLSGRDVAIIAKHLVNDYPSILQYTQKKTGTFPGVNGGATQKLTNTNILLGNKQYHIDGLKTGGTPRNGANLVSHGYLNGQPVITVVLNTNKLPRSAIGTETLSVLNQVKQQTKVMPVAAKGSVEIDNAKGNHGRVAVRTANDDSYFVNKNDQAAPSVDNLKPDVKQKAPLKTTDQIGSASVVFNNQAEDDFVAGSQAKVALYPQHNVQKANLWTTMMQKYFQ